MGRANKERQRQARRAAYQATKQVTNPEVADNFELTWANASLQEQLQEKQGRAQHNGKDTAVHEAGHAVAAWLQGERIEYMMFNDRGSAHYDRHLDQFNAVTVTGQALTADEIKNKKSALQGTAEGFVLGCKTAFIALAGAAAQGMYLEDKAPITMREHGSEAASKLYFFSGLPEGDVIAERNRILNVVIQTFSNERIHRITLALGDILYEKRYLSGESVTAIIQALWTASAQATAAEAGS
jgi:hypothetical protein